MRVTNMQLAHSNNRPACPIYSIYSPPVMDKSPKNVSMRSYRRLEVLSSFFSCNKLLISSSLGLEADHIFQIEDLSKKTFSLSSAVPASHLFPLFRENIWENTQNTSGEDISEAILWNPAVEAEKSLLGASRHLHMGRFFHLCISCFQESFSNCKQQRP